MSGSNLLFLIPALPLLGAITLGILSLLSARKEKGYSEKLLSILAVLFPAISFLITLLVSIQSSSDLGQGGHLRADLGTWFASDDFKVSFGVLFDNLSRIMLLFITGIGSLITLYSSGYMHGDRGFARFMAYLNLFLFSMITLVISDNLVLTFLGWEGVGLCSYLLIGFWHKDPANVDAANKAFLVNRAGDLGFLFGIFTLFALAGTQGIYYVELREFLTNPQYLPLLKDGIGQVMIVLAAFFLFWAATAKSAQIPLLTWLPDAMAGPTPVSALIHAATMVTSGVYLVARLADLFALAPLILNLITIVGLMTALWAAVVGLVQKDIKKVLAYSTVSQLGFMFLAAGVGAFDVAIFHVFTHAFFKAALFLGAGSVIHALAGEQDLRNMGGLFKKLPFTFGVLALGWISIIGIPGTAGFWSKDLILEKVYVSGVYGPILYVVALFTALLTALYMTRLMVLTFAGKFRSDHHVFDHAHESPWTMKLPMGILAVGSVTVGFLWAGLIPDADWFQTTLQPIVGHAQHMLHGETGAHHGPSPWIFALGGTAAALIGAGFAWRIFTRRIPAAPTPGEICGACWLTRLFDSIHLILIRPVQWLAWILDRLVQPMFEGVQQSFGEFAIYLADRVRKIQQPSIRMQLGLGMLVTLIFVALIQGGVL